MENGRVEIVGLVECERLGFVGKDDIDRARAQEIEKLLAIAMDAEVVGQGHGDEASGLMGDVGRLDDRFLGARRVPQIAFEIGDLGRLNDLFVDVLGAEFHAGAEIGVHGALAVRRHQDHASGGRRMAFERRRVIGNPHGADVVTEDRAELVGGNLAEIGARAAEAHEAGHGVGRAAAGGLDGRAHCAIEVLGALRVDQRHAALLDLVVRQKRVVAARNDVDDGIADGEEVVFGHVGPSCGWLLFALT